MLNPWVGNNPFWKELLKSFAHRLLQKACLCWGMDRKDDSSNLEGFHVSQLTSWIFWPFNQICFFNLDLYTCEWAPLTKSNFPSNFGNPWSRRVPRHREIQRILEEKPPHTPKPKKTKTSPCYKKCFDFKKKHKKTHTFVLNEHEGKQSGAKQTKKNAPTRAAPQGAVAICCRSPASDACWMCRKLFLFL